MIFSTTDKLQTCKKAVVTKLTKESCGVAVHDDDCLCDVNVDEPTPINFDPKTHWGVKIAVSAGYTYESPEELLDLLEALAKAKDAYENMKNFDRTYKGTFRVSKELVRDVKDWIRSGESIIDAVEHFREPWAHILAASTSGQPSQLWQFNEAKWAEFEDYFDEHPKPTYRIVMRDLNVERGPAVLLCDMYGTQARADQQAMRRRLRELLIAHHGQRNNVFVDWLRNEGFDVDKERVTMMIRRLRHLDLIPRRGELVGEWRARTGRVK